jgi:hypothetical protein
MAFYLDLKLTWRAKTYVQASEVPPGVGVGVLGPGATKPYVDNNMDNVKKLLFVATDGVMNLVYLFFALSATKITASSALSSSSDSAP